METRHGQESRQEDTTRQAAGTAAAASGGNYPSRISKTEAARTILAEGILTADEGIAAIQARYGIELTRGHFSSEKARYLKMQAETKAAAKRGRPPGSGGQKKIVAPAVEAKVSPKPKTAGTQGDIIATMEALKPLIDSLGAAKAHRLIDLLG